MPVNNIFDLFKTLVYLNNDLRWKNLRDYYMEEDAKGVTFIFGLIISVICPFIFQLQNIMLGLFITNGKLNKETFKHVIKTTRKQLVIIYDLTMFDRNPGKKIKVILRMAKLAIGYFFYVLPIGIIGYIFLFINSKSFICQEMKAPFLLDNSYEPAVNLTEASELRTEYKLQYVKS